MQSIAVVRRISASYVPGSLIERPELAPPRLKRGKAALEAIAVLVAALAIWFSACAVGRADSAQYYYDPAGRLTVVVDPTNGSAQYNYDAVGNILSVVRRPISDLVVAQASPSRGRAGDVITIYGTGFGSLANTTVSFNGVSASPATVSATQITVAVPSGATTGLLSVTSPAGSANSIANFTVPVSGLPTIASFSPSQVQPGDAITVTGTNFDVVAANNKLLINGRYAQVSSASATTLTAIVPVVSSGVVTVATPEGSASSTGYLTVAPRPYTVGNLGAVVASSIGSSATVNIATSGQIGLVQFEASSGRRLAIRVTASSIGSSTVQIVGPDAAVLRTSSVSNGSFVDTDVVGLTGTYAVLIAPAGASTGSITIQLVDVPPDPSAVLTAGSSPVSLTTTVPGQNMRLTFNGVAGQKIALLAQFSGLSGCLSFGVTIVQPGTVTLVNATGCGNGPLFTDKLTLPAGGTYTILVDLIGTNVGTGTFTLYTVPADATATIAANASPVSVATSVPGQDMRLTFNGSAGQTVALLAQFSGLGGCISFRPTILQPDGVTKLFEGSGCGNGPLFTDKLTLPVGGTYTILVDLISTNVGTGTFTLYTVPANASATIAANASPVSLTTTVPGQDMSLTFNGTAGQTVALFSQFGGLGGCISFGVTILQPDGVTKLFEGTGCGNGPLFTNKLSLPVTGVYTIQVWLIGTNVGTGTFTLYTVPSDANATIAANASPVSLTTTAPTQSMRLTFGASSGQRVTLQTQVGSGFGGCSSYGVRILQPDGVTQVYGNSQCGTNSDFSDALILPVAGTYTIVLSPSGMNFGTAAFTLTALPADASATVTPGGGTVALTTTVPGQNMSMSFTGSANQRVSLLMTLTSGLVPGCSPLTIVQPNGTTQLFFNGCANYASFFTDVLVLPVTGTYTIVFNPNTTSVGTGTFTLYDVPPDAPGSTSVGQAAANYDVTVPGQAIQVTFAGSGGQTATVSVGRVSSTPSGACYNITTKKPDGSSLRGDGSCNNGYSSGSLTLPTSGTYTVVVDPTSTSIGTFSVGVSTP